MNFSATYSPDDNKLRLYAMQRLDAETYARAKALGFRWAPKQELFVAPMWTPDREDFLIELAGEIEDEDKSLVERAEERAEQFEEYSANRLQDAKTAKAAVDRIADGIPFGQPILVGHHSERHARKDAERIENGMRKAVKMWEQSGYWTSRAAGAVQAAKYKELPAVRHRRIKTLTAEKRKVERSKSECEMWLKLWTECGNEPDTELQMGVAMRLANMCWLHLPRKEGDREDFPHTPTAYDALTNSHPTLYAPRTLAEIVEHAQKVYPISIAAADRWLAHYENRLAYETAMLDEQIGTGETGSGMGGRWDFQPGGKVFVRNEWLIIIRVNKAGGVVNSVTTQAPAGVTWQRFWKHEIERVKDYQPPTAELAAAVKKATKLPPICNYPGEGFKEMTEAEWNARGKWSDFPYFGVVSGPTVGKHRVRQMPAGMMKKQQVFLTDAKRVDPPAPAPASDPVAAPERTPTYPQVSQGRPEPTDDDVAFRDLKASLKAGVQVVTAPNLFPTPPDVAARLVGYAGVTAGDRVLEPSAGTGALVDAIHKVEGAQVVAVEINPTLAGRLEATKDAVVCGDFLQCTQEALWGTFDRIVMNPPFERGSDIKHVEHALTFLRPGGRLAAIVANGPRQQEKLKAAA